MRILAHTCLVTDKRDVAEEEVNVAVLGLNAQQASAVAASRGQYSKARMISKAAMRLAKKNVKSEQQVAELSAWASEATRLNKVIKKKKMEEKEEGVHYDSAEGPSCSLTFSSSFHSVWSGQPFSMYLCAFNRFLEDGSGSDDEGEPSSKKPRTAPSESMERFRAVRRTESDAMSNVMYQAQNPVFSRFKK